MSTHRLLAVAAGVLGLMALAADLPRPGAAMDVARLAREVEDERDHVTALELAAWIRDGKPGLRVVDVRDAAAYASYHIPTAEHATLSDLLRAKPSADETLVLYSEGGTHAAQGWLLLRAAGAEHVYVLREGLYEWLSTVLNPTLPDGATAAQRAAFDTAAALGRYFGGVPTIGGGAAMQGEEITPLLHAAPAESASTSLLRTIRRRGC